MKTLKLNRNSNETQEELSERASQIASEMREKGKVIMLVSTTPEYSEIDYWDD